jgi:hypothetical protein
MSEERFSRLQREILLEVTLPEVNPPVRGQGCAYPLRA